MCSNWAEDKNLIRSKTLMDYRFHGYKICMKSFLFLHGIGRKRLRLLRKRVTEFSIAPHRHGNAGRHPKHACNKENTTKVVQFLINYAENNALVLPGKTRGIRDHRTMLLPSWESKKEIHAKYVASCEAAGIRSLKRNAFYGIWREALPFIVIQRPRSDLCGLCQKNTMKMSEMANLDDDIKRKRVNEMMQHLKLVEKERSVYHSCIQMAKEKKISHLSFDYAHQIFLPNLPDQPGPIFFLTPFKVGIFGIANEAEGSQHNYLIPENMLTGKGANCIISMLHHYLAAIEDSNQDTLILHADNCVGKNKNNIVMQYLAWRVAVGLNSKITIMFLPVGHTKFAPDAGFGILKSKFRRTELASVQEFATCVEDSTPISKLNKAVLVGDESGTIFVPTFDWQERFSSTFKPIPHLKQWHLFTFECRRPGFVTYKNNSDSPEGVFNMLLPNQRLENIDMPNIMEPVPLSPERQWYLYDNIQSLVPERGQDAICPKPAFERITFAQVNFFNNNNNFFSIFRVLLKSLF